MAQVKFMFTFIVVMAGIAVAQSSNPIPPSPPPQPTGVQSTSPPQNQQGASAPQSTTQNPTEPTVPASTSQTPAQNPTQPSIPTTKPEAGSSQPAKLPESDVLELERLNSEVARIEAKKETIALHNKAGDRIRESTAVLKELLSGPTKISNSLLDRSKCVIVIPSVKKAAVVFGVKYGRGVMSCRSGEDLKGAWSAPSMYALEGGNFGFQIGLQATDLVLLIMNERGADSLIGNKVKLGGDMSAAAGPVGRSAEASTDLAMRAKILSYSRARGLFVGIAVDGATVRPDNRANEALYGHELSGRDIVRKGAVSMPREAAPLLQLLEQHAASESNTPAQQVRK